MSDNSCARVCVCACVCACVCVCVYVMVGNLSTMAANQVDKATIFRASLKSLASYPGPRPFACVHGSLLFITYSHAELVSEYSDQLKHLQEEVKSISKVWKEFLCNTNRNF